MVLFVQHSETRSVWLGKAISWTWRRCPPGAPIPARLLGQMWMWSPFTAYADAYLYETRTGLFP